MPESSLPNGEINNKGHKNVKSDKKYTTEPNLFTAREQNKKAGCCLAPLQCLGVTQSYCCCAYSSG